MDDEIREAWDEKYNRKYFYNKRTKKTGWSREEVMDALEVKVENGTACQPNNASQQYHVRWDDQPTVQSNGNGISDFSAANNKALDVA